MALDISGATFGVDENGIQSFINELNTQCIQDTINKMNSGLAELRTAVDEAWVGVRFDSLALVEGHYAKYFRKSGMGFRL